MRTVLDQDGVINGSVVTESMDTAENAVTARIVWVLSLVICAKHIVEAHASAMCKTSKVQTAYLHHSLQHRFCCAKLFCSSW